MRILMIVSNTVGKGTYWRALYLARSLAKNNHKVTIIATSVHSHFRIDTKTDNVSGVTLVEMPDLLFGALRSGWDIWNCLRRVLWGLGKEFDLVHAFESRPVTIIPSIYWSRLRHVTLIMDWCDWFGKGGSVEERRNLLTKTILRPVETFFEEHFRTVAQGTTVINRFLFDRAVELGVSTKTIYFLPNGSNIDDLQPIPQDEARNALGLPSNVPIIGYIGTIFLQDAHLMARAFDLIKETASDTILLIAGYCHVPIENMVKDPSSVIRTGKIPFESINQYLAACDVCWLPFCDSGANRGRFPLKLNDYMAVGKAVVVTDIGDVGKLVRAGEFGLVSQDSAEQLAEQVIYLFQHPRLRDEMGQRARYLAETKYSWNHIGQQLEDFYYVIVD